MLLTQVIKLKIKLLNFAMWWGETLAGIVIGDLGEDNVNEIVAIEEIIS